MKETIHPKYGPYHGKLVPLDELPEDIDFTAGDIKELTKDFAALGVTEVLCDVYEDEDDPWTNTIFFTTTDQTDYKYLMVALLQMHSYEFEEITPNCFRAWYDT